MIRVLYFSDAHIEIRQSDESHPWSETRPLGFGPDLRPFVGTVDLLVLAGDIGRIHSTRNVSPLSYAEQAAAFLGSQVILVPGNHEYYRGSFDEDRAALLTATNPGVVVLDRGEVVVRRSSRALRILGATLWTDYAVTGAREQAMVVAERQLHDHRLIQRSGSRPFLPKDALAEHQLSRAWLASKLAEAHDGPTLVVTHHVPHSAACHPTHGLNELGPAFCSDCDDLIAAASLAGVNAWIFGHHHWSHAVEVAGVRLFSAQPGYPGENTAWIGPGYLEL
ncbi:MAG: metallophosphoesterase [Hyphomicrobiales bacterium]|nr:metallophosphoesterase [Hyphomicrobiales bacterium]MDE1974309.1 metallophosphoesterase [Hyphomicrobiales bacterium]MDE2285058.1 metallophosphoesterase [Hyphomicrobiales bacterium]